VIHIAALPSLGASVSLGQLGSSAPAVSLPSCAPMRTHTTRSASRPCTGGDPLGIDATIISGGGHITPADVYGRRTLAEDWCLTAQPRS